MGFREINEGMELSKLLPDVVLVPLGVCLTSSYHVYLWRHKHARSKAAVLPRSSTGWRAWIQKISQEKEKGGDILGAQSFRNSIMSSTVNAIVAILINIALGAMSSNAFSAATGGESTFLQQPAFGGGLTVDGAVVLLKYAMPSLILLTSFVLNTMAIWCANDSNFLLNSGEAFYAHGRALHEKGRLLAAVGNRMFFVAFPLLTWFFGPVALLVSSVATIYVFYNLDFVDDAKMKAYVLNEVKRAIK